MSPTRATDKAPEAQQKAPEGPNTPNQEPKTDQKADREANSRRLADRLRARRALGFPDRELKDVKRDGDDLQVTHVGGAEYRVHEDNTTEAISADAKHRWPRRPVVANGADVPAVVTEASDAFHLDRTGSSEADVDIDPKEHARLSELIEPEDDTDSASKADGMPKTEDGGTVGTTDADRARRSA